MKSLSTILLTIWMLTSPTLADVPKGTYKITDLEKARAEALKRNKAVAFLASVPESEYRNTQQATDLAIKELRSYAVIVFLISKKDGEPTMPPPVVTGLRGSNMGTFDPRFVILSADLKETFETAGNEQITGDPAYAFYKELRKSMRKHLADWKPSTQIPDDELTWVKSDGRHYRGKFIEVKDERLHVESEKFGKGSVALSELGPGSLAYAKLLSDKKPAPTETKLESWKNTDGKAIEARFVSLKNNQLTVETDAGKSYTFPLDRLDQTSQAKAKKLATE